MPCRDVPGRVHIGVARETAGYADERRLALAAFGCGVPTRATLLAGESGIDLLYPSGSLLFQAAYQQAPARRQNLAIQPGLTATMRKPSSRPAFRQVGLRCVRLK
jgi:hypothetical protein